MDDQKRIENEFGSLPLDEKISTLFRMEVSTIREAVQYAVKEPMKVAEKIGEMFVELGHRVESEFKNAGVKNDTSESATQEKKSKKHRPPRNPRSKPDSV